MDHDNLIRYSRQIILDQVGMEGQQRLKASKVFVAGAGGLGSPILLYLASAGIGTLGIADFDQVGLSNLQRQVLYHTEDIGVKKVDAACAQLSRMNPALKLRKYRERLRADNIEELVEDFDVVLDATDNIASRYLINDCCFFLKKPLVTGAVRGFDGMLMTILPGKSACYRCLYPAPPENGVLPSCSETGILGAAAGVIGSLQALEAIKLLLGKGEAAAGRLLALNGLNMTFDEIDVPRRTACPLCGEEPSIRYLEEYHVRCGRALK